MPSIYLTYGSESGNVQHLATLLNKQLSEKGFTPTQYCELNDIDISGLQSTDTLIIIASSFGDGEPTGNAETFYEQLTHISRVYCSYAVFGLGDVSYPKFCGFSKEIDALLRTKGAKQLAKRVDADTNFHPFFEQWSEALITYFSGDNEALQQLQLQVSAYDQQHSFPATIQSVYRNNSGDFPAYDIVINISGSNMNYQAGDLLYIVPPVNQSTLDRITDFYGVLNDKQRKDISSKELRLLSKPLFRSLTKVTGNKELKALTKMSASAELASYCHGRDIADVLNDYCSPEDVPIDRLIETLSEKLPRAYSIASCGSVSPHVIRLCIREVTYHLGDTDYVGTTSHFLAQCSTGDTVNVFTRANPHFHLPNNENTPIIMIGAGVGIAPFLGFLANQRNGEAYLFFGERHLEHDFLYQKELKEHLHNGNLTQLFTAFSRDQEEKTYVQDLLTQHGELLWNLIARGAHIYVCGSKKNLRKPIDDALCEIAKYYGGFEDEKSQQWLYGLLSNQRYHQDLY